MRRLALVLLGVVVAAAFSAVAFAGSSSTNAKSPIIIGYAIGLTGAASAFDVPIYQAAKIAAADINKAGGVAGHPLKVIAIDTQSKFTNGPSAAQQAIEKGAKIITGSCDYDFGGPA
jgi:branched-chain amino acid transport system substrate-binding protein